MCLENALCPICEQEIKNRGEPFKSVLDNILEGFCLVQEPVALVGDGCLHAIVDYLEKCKYILTTEFPDPYKENRDILLAIPKGSFNKDDGYFCFHEGKH